MAEAGIGAHVAEGIEEKKRGLVARLVRTAPVEDAKVQELLGGFTRPWEWTD